MVSVQTKKYEYTIVDQINSQTFDKAILLGYGNRQFSEWFYWYGLRETSQMSCKLQRQRLHGYGKSMPKRVVVGQFSSLCETN
tara:strand:- start:2042 stop:2290 length:249 start_codon:yes stop_codon:yes gene_type:complete